MNNVQILPDTAHGRATTMASMSDAADAEGKVLLSQIRTIAAELAADAENRERERAELTVMKETIVARVDQLEKVRYSLRYSLQSTDGPCTRATGGVTVCQHQTHTYARAHVRTALPRLGEARSRLRRHRGRAAA